MVQFMKALNRMQKDHVAGQQSETGGNVQPGNRLKNYLRDESIVCSSSYTIYNRYAAVAVERVSVNKVTEDGFQAI